MTTLSASTIAHFKGAGVFRVKTDEKARERFDDALADYDGEASDPDALFALLIEHRDGEARKRAERARIKAEKDAAKPLVAGMDTATGHVTDFPAGVYVLTSAQNNTAVDADFLASLKRYCIAEGARLMVSRLTYNKAGFQQPGVDADDIWYDPEIVPFLVKGQINLDGRFHFVADANVIPTAKWPTSGFDGITPAGVGAIIPATKIELRMSAALKGAVNKVIAATGAVTKRNYILRKTGAIANFSHCISAIVVDTRDGSIRHLHQLDGQSGFYDVDGFYSPDSFLPLVAGDVAALQFGDIHAEKMDGENMEAAIALIDRFQPTNVVLHDVLDFSSRNHHNIKDPMFLHEQLIAGNSVRKDLQTLAKVLDDITGASNANVHIVESNHDLAINTWLKTADFKIDPLNGTVYLECMLAKYRHVEERRGGYFNMLAFAYREIGGGEYSEDIHFHETDESLSIAGVEMGNHGHNGANGSRGSPKQFASLGVPMNTGHTHSPSVYWPVFTAGVTASLEMGYNIGPSSWAIAHVVTYDNGQRQIIFG